MSGSLIIQDGKLISEVSHAWVNEIKTRYLLQEIWHRYKGVAFKGSRFFLICKKLNQGKEEAKADGIMLYTVDIIYGFVFVTACISVIGAEIIYKTKRKL